MAGPGISFCFYILAYPEGFWVVFLHLDWHSTHRLLYLVYLFAPSILKRRRTTKRLRLRSRRGGRTSRCSFFYHFSTSASTSGTAILYMCPESLPIRNSDSRVCMKASIGKHPERIQDIRPVAPKRNSP
jgi:hypothetical protein